jgi:hypothetical protein
MRIASPSRLVMTARTDKEARLKNFIAEGLAHRVEGQDSPEPLTVVARNVDSPVARALLAALSEDGRAYGVRIVLADTNVDEPAQSTVFDILSAEFRVLADSRFGSAHEQLVLSRSHVWIGDCLRRDPTKRDAFELYHTEDASAGLYAAASFERLWTIAKPVRTLKSAKSEDVTPEIFAAGQTEEAAGSLPDTPHH